MPKFFGKKLSIVAFFLLAILLASLSLKSSIKNTIIPQVQAQSSDRPYPIGWWGYMYNAPVLPDMGANMSSLTHSQDAAMLWASGQGNLVDAYLNTAHANGIKVIFDLRLEVLQLSETRFRQMIRAYKDHPALYGWYISDEPDYNNTPASLIQTYYDIIKQEDPNHPVSLVFIGWYHHTDHLGVPYITAYDQLMIDWYPGWNSPNQIDSMIQQSYSIWKGGLDEARRYGKKYLAIGLGFGTPWIVRNLTIDEYRYHTFSAIVLGVDGFLYWWTDWAYGRNWPNSTANSTVVNNVNTVIRQVQAIGAEMKNGATNDPQISTNQAVGNLVYRYGANGNRRVILAVNISGTSLSNVQFTLPAGTQSTQVEVLDENRSISVSGGTFTDYFAPLAVHAYAFTSGGSLPASPSPSPSPVTGSPSPSPSLTPGLSVVRAPSGGVTIDGNLSEFAGADSVTFSDNSNRGNNNDNTAAVKAMWDNDYLYIGYDVTDTKLNALVTSPGQGAIWEDDDLEILIDRNNDHGTWKSADDHQYFVNLHNIRDDQGENLGANDFKSAVLLNGTLNNNSDTDQGYKIEMALAWSALGGAPAPGGRIGIDFAAGDKDLASDGYQYYDWANLTDFGQPDKWNDLVFSNNASSCSADMNNDGVVNVSDLIQILQAWGSCSDCQEDTNGDGNVNIADVIALLQAWQGC